MAAQYAEESVQLYKPAVTNAAAGQDAVYMAAATEKYITTAQKTWSSVYRSVMK
jgi:hypothetical protein